MAGIKIINLPAAPSAQLTDVFPVSQGGTTYKETNAQLLTLFQSFPGGAGGSNTQIQYNNSGALAGDSGFTTNGNGTLVASTSLSVANLNLAANTLRSTNTNGNIIFSPNGTGTNITGATASVDQYFNASPSSFDIIGGITAGKSNPALNIAAYSTFPSYLNMAKSNSTTLGTFSAVTSNEVIGYINFWADDGTQFTNTAQILVASEGTVSNGIVPSIMVLSASNTLGQLVPSLQLINDGSIALHVPLSGVYGGTGVNNGSSTFTFGGNTAFSGAFTFTGTVTGNTAVTFPTSGTLATTAQIINWAVNSSSSFAAAVGNGYILTSASPTTVTLPTTFAVGSRISIAGQGAAWTLALGASTNIKAFGNTYTTSFASTNNTDTIELVATVANTTWAILGMSSTGFTAS